MQPSLEPLENEIKNINEYGSYLQVSPVPETCRESDEVVLGIDEAGRGPVLGEFSSPIFGLYQILTSPRPKWLML